MKLKQSILAVALTLLNGHSASAQENYAFREVEYTPRETKFQLFAPSDAKVTVQLYAQGEARGEQPLRRIEMKRVGKDLWHASVKGDWKGKFYTFDIGRGLGETPGVFARAVGVNGDRGAIVDFREAGPTRQKSHTALPPIHGPQDLVIYEMHFRDFSVSRPEARYPGKFLALTEPWALDHLKRLGVNAVHILPSFDFGSIDETRLDRKQYNWGYDPKNYNVPEGSYSTDPYNPLTRIREFKQMVEALHRAGIRVILDVVYNHTYDLEHSNFNRTYPHYFYRYTADGKPSDGSGCGNETASEQPMMRRFIVESMKYWVEEYGIDGFRVDLMGVHDIETMNAVRQALNRIDPFLIIYGEGWSAGKCAYPTEKLALKAHTSQMPGIGAFSDELRDALRGPFNDDHKGAFLAGIAGSEESIKAGIAGLIAHPQIDYSRVNYSDSPWAKEPSQMVSYVSCHDDMCLTDRLKASIPGLTEAELIRLDLLAQTAVLTSQGTPFVLSGEEMLRSKQGVHNSFQSPDSINELPWGNLQRYPAVFDYYRGLIALRNHHPAFRLGSSTLVRKHLEFLPVKPCLVAFRLKANAGGDAWRDIIVVLNANREAQTVNLPTARYTVVVSKGKVDEAGLGSFTGSQVTVEGQSALILHD